MITMKHYIIFFMLYYSCAAGLIEFFDFSDFIASLKGDNIEKREESKRECNENSLLLQLGQIYVSSPERIVYLLTTAPVNEICKDVANVVTKMHSTMKDCKISNENLYKKLANGLDYLNEKVCLSGQKKNSVRKEIQSFEACLQELREEFLDCEGPADWFETKDKSDICRYINEIADCLYVKTALLCGRKSGKTIRNFSADLMNKVTESACKLQKKLSDINDPLFKTYGNALKLQKHIKKESSAIRENRKLPCFKSLK